MHSDSGKVPADLSDLKEQWLELCSQHHGVNEADSQEHHHRDHDVEETENEVDVMLEEGALAGLLCLLKLIEVTAGLVQSPTFHRSFTASESEEDSAAKCTHHAQGDSTTTVGWASSGEEEGEGGCYNISREGGATVPLLVRMRSWCISQTAALASEDACVIAAAGLHLAVCRQLLRSVSAALALSPAARDAWRMRPLLVAILAASEQLSTAEIASLLLSLARCGCDSVSRPSPLSPSLASGASFTALGELHTVAAEICRRLEPYVTAGDATEPPPLALSLAAAKRLQREATVTTQAKQKSNDGDDDDDDDNNLLSDRASVTLLDVAEIATGLAILRYTEPTFWTSLALFTVKFVETHQPCAKRTSGAAVDSLAVEAVEGAVASVLLLKDLQAVCFALCRVGRLDLYDALMTTLVRHGLLDKRIPPIT
jgi:hypothetical protein